MRKQQASTSTYWCTSTPARHPVRQPGAAAKGCRAAAPPPQLVAGVRLGRGLAGEGSRELAGRAPPRGSCALAAQARALPNPNAMAAPPLPGQVAGVARRLDCSRRARTPSVYRCGAGRLHVAVCRERCFATWQAIPVALPSRLSPLSSSTHHNSPHRSGTGAELQMTCTAIPFGRSDYDDYQQASDKGNGHCHFE